MKMAPDSYQEGRKGRGKSKFLWHKWPFMQASKQPNPNATTRNSTANCKDSRVVMWSARGGAGDKHCLDFYPCLNHTLISALKQEGSIIYIFIGTVDQTVQMVFIQHSIPTLISSKITFLLSPSYCMFILFW